MKLEMKEREREKEREMKPLEICNGGATERWWRVSEVARCSAMDDQRELEETNEKSE